MLAEHKKKASIAIIVSLLLMSASGYMAGYIANPVKLAGAFAAWLLFFGLFLWGSFYLMKGKGYSGWTSLLAFLLLPGLIVMLLMPDKLKEQQSKG